MINLSDGSSFLRQPFRRRAILKALGAAGVGVAVLPLLPNGARAADEAIYFTWGGYDDENMHAPYREQFGALPTYATYGDSEEGLQKLRAGFVADVVHPCTGELPRWKDADVIQPVDVQRLKNWVDLFESLKELPAINLDGQIYMVPWDWGITSITYRTDLVELPDGAESWAILWDDKNKGRISIIDSAEDSWYIAAIYGGIPLEGLNDEAIAKVRTLLEQQRPLLRMYSSDNTVQEQALASGELVAAMTWADAANNLMKQGLPVKFAQPKEGALTWVCGLVIHKNAPNIDKAYALIDAMLEPSVGEYCIDAFGYGHSNRKSFEGFDAERLAAVGIVGSPAQTLESGHFYVPQPSETMEKIYKDWEDVKSGF